MSAPIKRLMQHDDETAIEYLRRVVNNLNFETESFLTDLPSIDAILDYFDLWQTYDTDLLTGIIAAVEAGQDAAPYNSFIAKYNLPWSSYINNEWVEAA